LDAPIVCHEPTSRPPLPPISGGSGIASAEDLVLRSSDGTRFAAFCATSDAAGAPGVVILPDVRGLHPYYKELAERFAAAGMHATAFDYFGRTAGLGERGDGFTYRPHADAVRGANVTADVATAIAHARSEAGGGARDVYTVGFCFGGRMSFSQAARQDGLSGVIGFYGWPQASDERDPESPISLVPEFRCPVLALFGAADTGIPPSAVQDFRSALDGAGVPNEIVVYDGAPHSFFDRAFVDFADACDDAWRRVLAFVRMPAV
jgi:carboxymethylenebutenolidase